MTAQDLDRVLALGRLLLSVLTPEELDQLRDDLIGGKSNNSEANRARKNR